ncbi:MAG: peptide chain release factor N(5)-glutamine methyltransferase [Thermomicrobiales bacterium]
MRVAEALAEAAGRLSGAGIETARLDAEVLLRHVLGIDRTGLFLRMREPLGEAALAAFDALIERRLTRMPVAYLTGTREFMGLSFAVGPGVLVPRLETESLVEWAARWLTERPEATVVDVGTGSGAIAVSLAATLATVRQGRVVAVDISPVALTYAARNRSAHLPSGRLHLVRGSLLSWCRGPVDLVLANLPYLRPDQIEANPDLRAEPALALAGGPDGLDLIAGLLSDAPRVLASKGALGLEVDPAHAARVADLARAAFPAASISVASDWAGLERFVLVETAPRPS